MTSWHEPKGPRMNEAAFGFVVIACAVPILFFTLDFLLTWIAGWFV